MAGLITGAMLSNIGQAGNTYVGLRERERLQEQANQDRLGQLAYAQNLGQEAKDADLKRQTERMTAFQGAAAEWRKENPGASISDFATHFASSEFADLLKPTLEAAGFSSQEGLRQLQGEESKARTGLLEAQRRYTEEEKGANERIRAEAAREKAEAATARANAPAGGRTGGGRSVSDRLSEKDFNSALRDMQKANPITNVATGQPDALGHALQGNLYRQVYDETGNTAAAESVAIGVTRAALDFAEQEAAKRGGRLSPAERQSLLNQGAQKRLYELGKEREAQLKAEAEDKARAGQWGGEGRMARGSTPTEGAGATGAW